MKIVIRGWDIFLCLTILMKKVIHILFMRNRIKTAMNYMVIPQLLVYCVRS